MAFEDHASSLDTTGTFVSCGTYPFLGGDRKGRTSRSLRGGGAGRDGGGGEEKSGQPGGPGGAYHMVLAKSTTSGRDKLMPPDQSL